MSLDYWIEMVQIALDEADITASDGQVKQIARSMESAAEMEGEYTGRINIPDPRTAELAAVKEELRKERRKTVCPECHGSGALTFGDGVRYSISQCDYCRGDGKK